MDESRMLEDDDEEAKSYGLDVKEKRAAAQLEFAKLIEAIAARLASTPITVLEHSYQYEIFGSWWFTFEKSNAAYRIVLDGKERSLSLQGKVRSGRWMDIGFKKLPFAYNRETYADAVSALIQAQATP